MYIDVPATPQAVVICVIVFNAAFGYSWGPIPWLYPPEVGASFNIHSIALTDTTIDYASHCPCQGRVLVYSGELGVQLPRGRAHAILTGQ